ncbi:MULTISPECIES: hypothetical protein [unclassified Stenotrophomonas]|uniref:hypothetical protein n=1 Tax=unclassified Stenotrophomonas TaxID=196198 RepID=UPI0010577B6A|nr:MULTISPECIES: hypothetical protein [unclassified Stenotrophomonas]
MIDSIDPSDIAVTPSGAVSINDEAAQSLQRKEGLISPLANSGCSNPSCNVSCTNTTDCTGTNNRGCTNRHICYVEDVPVFD